MGAEDPRDGEPVPTPVLRLITRLKIGGPGRQALLLTRSLAPEFATTLAAGRPRRPRGS